MYIITDYKFMNLTFKTQPNIIISSKFGLTSKTPNKVLLVTPNLHYEFKFKKSLWLENLASDGPDPLIQAIALKLPEDNEIMNNNIHHNYSSVQYFHSVAHLGDSVFNMIFFNLIEGRIVADNILFCYFVKKEYIQQLRQFINSRLINNVKLFTLDKKPQSSIDLWIDNPYFWNGEVGGYESEEPSGPLGKNFNQFYLKFFRNVLHTLKINANIQSILYSDNDLLVRADAIPREYKPVDVLILNSRPYSGQYMYDKNKWDKYIRHIHFNSKLKIVTTTKVPGVLCTFDKNMTIKDIAALSTQAKVVIAVNSGVFPGLLNVHTIESIRQFYLFDNRCYYSFPRFQNKRCITEISINELNYYVTLGV